MTSPENSPSPEMSYEPGQAVRVYVQQGEELVPEDDWEYQAYFEGPDVEVSAKNPADGGETLWAHINKAEFDRWQLERMAEAAGDLITSETVETTEEAEEIIDEEQQAEDSHRPSWGEFNEQGKYVLTVDAEQLAKQLEIPKEIIEAAAEKGFPPESLLAARTNPYTSERLRKAGVDFGPELKTAGSREGVNTWTNAPPDLPKDKEGKKINIEDMTPSEMMAYYHEVDRFEKSTHDPVFRETAKGVKKKIQNQITADRIETEPRKLKGELKRPGELPLKLHYLVGRQAGRLLLARAMHRQEKKEGKALEHEDGLLRLGIPRTRRHLSKIKRHDENIRVLRNKLQPWNNHEYKGAAKSSARRDLAELINRAIRQQEALQDKKSHHEDVYVHKPVKAELDDFNKSKDKSKDA